MSTPAVYDISLYQGDTFELTFRLRDQNADGTLGAYIDLTGCTAKSQIRTASTTVDPLAEFTAVILDQTVTPGGVRLSLTHTETAALTPTTGSSYVWDVQISTTDTPPKVTTYLRGAVTVQPEVTR